jgi:type I restriction enzyme M protein
VLDPACGTAGFLISSYKHILKANTDAKSNSTLTPDDKGRLAKNFKGYDISPDMVRLSLVNLYLHGFADPHIAEYDTLTSQDKWNEYADVILANPPFMSPKGGIKPHNRFSVQSKRSEVLFVDYMAEHLTPSGRAGIIVPEGIIFQSQTAYKQLRKMLVEENLVAVVSLPAGVFNPYSGVKTSILILDKSLAKKSNTIAFFKIENDGFGLGAQRREIAKNDIPQVHAEISEYLRRLRAGEALEGFLPTMGLIVEKEKIAANGEYNLSGERYREGAISTTSYKLVPVGRFMKPNVKTIDPRNTPDEIFELWSIPAFDAGCPELLRGIEIGSQKKVVTPGDVLLSRIIPHIRRGWIVRENPVGRRQIASTEWIVFSSNEVVPGFLRQLLVSDFFHVSFMQTITGVGGSLSRANPAAVGEIQIPLPPLEVQKEIVSEIEGYQKVINGARAVLDNYKPHIPIDPEWPMKSISEISERITKGSSPNWQGINYTTEEHGILFVTSENVGLGQLLLDKPKYVERRFNEIETKSILQKGDVLTNIVGASIGRTAIFDLDIVANVNQAVCVIRPNTALVNSTYLMSFLNSPEFIQKLLGNSVENARANVSMGVLGSLTIPLPPLDTQRSIVAEIEAEQALVSANRELIARFEKKIQTTLSRIWGEDNPAPTEA